MGVLHSADKFKYTECVLPPMEEREIIDVVEIAETDVSEDTRCMSATTQGAAACGEYAANEISLTYEDEPEKTFFTYLCEDCTADYVRRWDKANIFGDDVLESSDFQ